MKKSLGYVFPGQGSQRLGMLSELADEHDEVVATFQAVSDKLGYDLWSLVQNGPEAQLNQTEFTQAAMLTADVAVFQVLKKAGLPKADMMAGHSLGEYAALVCAGALTITDAAQLVTRRGQLMQQHVPMGQGAMAAIIGLDASQVIDCCTQATQGSETVAPANFNDLTQIVIAGHTAAVKRAIALAEAMNARMAVLIPVSVPCHCSLLTGAADEFTNELARVDFSLPDTAVISNVDLSIYQSVEQMRALLAAQLYKPVRWVETIQLMKTTGIELIVECGPGKVLSGLIKRIDRSFAGMSVNDPASLAEALTKFD